MSNPYPPLWQQQISAFLPKPSALLSITGSVWIASDILRSPTKKQNTHHRFLLSVSLCDIVLSFCILVGTLAMPRDTSYGTNNVYAYGNIETCLTQGFFVMAGSGMIPMYNACIGINAVLFVRYRFRISQIKKFERWVHLFIITVGLIGSISSVIIDALAPLGMYCALGAVPEGCGKTNSCVRGAGYHYIGLLYNFPAIMGSIIIAVVTMVLLYRTVHRTEQSTANYSMRAQGNNARSRRVAKQAILYIASFLIVYSFTMIVEFEEFFTGKVTFAFRIMCFILYPSQGFLNAIIYKCNSMSNARNPSHKPTGVLSSIISSTRSSLASTRGSILCVFPGRNLVRDPDADSSCVNEGVRPRNIDDEAKHNYDEEKIDIGEFCDVTLTDDTNRSNTVSQLDGYYDESDLAGLYSIDETPSQDDGNDDDGHHQRLSKFEQTTLADNASVGTNGSRELKNAKMKVVDKVAVEYAETLSRVSGEPPREGVRGLHRPSRFEQAMLADHDSSLVAEGGSWSSNADLDAHEPNSAYASIFVSEGSNDASDFVVKMRDTCVLNDDLEDI